MSKVLHKRSSVITEGTPYLPTPETLEYREIAINYAQGVETIVFKNSADEIIKITPTELTEKINTINNEINMLSESYVQADNILKTEVLGEIDSLINDVNNKQEILKSGVNIKTINDVSLLGSGNISIITESVVLSYDNYPIPNSKNIVYSYGIYNALKGDILFESTTPNYGNIELSMPSENYMFLEIYAETNDGVSLYSKVYNPNGKKISITHSSFKNSGYHICFKSYLINNNIIETVTAESGSVETTNNDKHIISNNTNVIGVIAVIGRIKK